MISPSAETNFTYSHKMDSAASNSHPCLQSLLLSIHTLEGRQQRWVDVQQLS